MPQKNPTNKKSAKITIVKNGPYIVRGSLPLDRMSTIQDGDGVPKSWVKVKEYNPGKEYSLCRCGQSANKPFCDSTHAKIKFIGIETASRELYAMQAKEFGGPVLRLKDATKLCAGTSFCSRAGGTWNLVERPADKEARKVAVESACNCPSGRLVIIDKKTGEEIEPRFQPSLSIVEEPAKGVSGPIWVKGKVKIVSAEGREYEARNRVTLCRCGKSGNKPFCDAAHVRIKFKD